VIVAVAGPPKVTVPMPCDDPKFVPVIVTDVPTGPDVVDKLVIFGAGTSVNASLLLGTPLTVTTTFPFALLGTVATIDVALQVVVVAVVVPNVTLPVVPKFVPVIVTEAPTATDVGDTLIMFGVGNTVKELLLLLFTPLA
jgi:hypothetical protein